MKIADHEVKVDVNVETREITMDVDARVWLDRLTPEDARKLGSLLIRASMTADMIPGHVNVE